MTRVLANYLPPTSVELGRHVEPFCGGASIYLAASRGDSGLLADVNEPLISFWRCLRENLCGLVEGFQSLGRPSCRQDFEAVRSRDPATMTPTERAAWFLYVNHYGFNGLWRVNRKNRVNVAWGGDARSKRPLDTTLLNNVSLSIRNVEFLHADFRSTLAKVTAGDFVYLDPPYVEEPGEGNVRYSSAGFSEDDHRELSAQIAHLTALGAHVMMSNSYTSRTKTLYQTSGLQWFTLRNVQRSVAPRTEGRNAVKELVGTNYDPSALARAS